MRTIRYAAATTLTASLILGAVGAAAAQPSDVPDVDLTGPAVVQDVSEVVSVDDIQVGLVNVQDAVNGASAGAPVQGP